MLLHPPAEWDIVRLRVSPERMEEEDRVLVPHLEKPLTCVGHQESVAVVDGIPELESKDGVRVALLELLAELRRGETEAVEAIVVLDGVYHLEIASDEPVPGTSDGLVDVGQAGRSGAPRPRYPLLFVVLVNLNAVYIIVPSMVNLGVNRIDSRVEVHCIVN